MRIRHAHGQSPGHEHRGSAILLEPRADNAQAKTHVEHVVLPISVALGRLYSEYMHAEYGEFDSD